MIFVLSTVVFAAMSLALPSEDSTQLVLVEFNTNRMLDVLFHVRLKVISVIAVMPHRRSSGNSAETRCRHVSVVLLNRPYLLGGSF